MYAYDSTVQMVCCQPLLSVLAAREYKTNTLFKKYASLRLARHARKRLFETDMACLPQQKCGLHHYQQPDHGRCEEDWMVAMPQTSSA
jgi:hypothetical protein